MEFVRLLFLDACNKSNILRLQVINDMEAKRHDWLGCGTFSDFFLSLRAAFRILSIL
jgi:hypothetical protein